ncbi:MAG: hypothetical protein WBX25_14230 [Rhodomicrobium sp.]
MDVKGQGRAHPSKPCEFFATSPNRKTYPVDIDPAQLVRWIRAECERDPWSFRIAATRKQEVRDLPTGMESHLGDQERDDLNEVATIVTLEIAPAHKSEGWLLRIVVVDEAGPRLLDGAIETGRERQIGLGTFYKQFICPERGIAEVIAEVDTPAAKMRLTRVLSRIERNSHGLPKEPPRSPRDYLSRRASKLRKQAEESNDPWAKRSLHLLADAYRLAAQTWQAPFPQRPKLARPVTALVKKKSRRE